MVELNSRKVDVRMNFLKLSNCFVLVPEDNLIQGCLFFLHGKRFVRNQSHWIIRKSICGLSLDSQQGRVSVIYGNMSLLAIITPQVQVIASIFIILGYWFLLYHIGHIYRTAISFGSGARNEKNNHYFNSSGGLSGDWVLWIIWGFDSRKIECVGLNVELRLLANFLHDSIYVTEQ